MSNAPTTSGEPHSPNADFYVNSSIWRAHKDRAMYMPLTGFQTKIMEFQQTEIHDIYLEGVFSVWGWTFMSYSATTNVIPCHICPLLPFWVAWVCSSCPWSYPLEGRRGWKTWPWTLRTGKPVDGWGDTLLRARASPGVVSLHPKVDKKKCK